MIRDSFPKSTHRSTKATPFTWLHGRRPELRGCLLCWLPNLHGLSNRHETALWLAFWTERLVHYLDDDKAEDACCRLKALLLDLRKAKEFHFLGLPNITT